MIAATHSLAPYAFEKRMLKCFTFVATASEDLWSKWYFVFGIEETILKETMDEVCDGLIQFERNEIYMLGLTIIYQKAEDLLGSRTSRKSFLFSPFEILETKREFGKPDYEAGGLFLWLLDSEVKSIR